MVIWTVYKIANLWLWEQGIRVYIHRGEEIISFLSFCLGWLLQSLSMGIIFDLSFNNCDSLLRILQMIIELTFPLQLGERGVDPIICVPSYRIHLFCNPLPPPSFHWWFGLDIYLTESLQECEGTLFSWLLMYVKLNSFAFLLLLLEEGLTAIPEKSLNLIGAVMFS